MAPFIKCYVHNSCFNYFVKPMMQPMIQLAGTCQIDALLVIKLEIEELLGSSPHGRISMKWWRSGQKPRAPALADQPNGNLMTRSYNLKATLLVAAVMLIPVAQAAIMSKADYKAEKTRISE